MPRTDVRPMNVALLRSSLLVVAVLAVAGCTFSPRSSYLDRERAGLWYAQAISVAVDATGDDRSDEQLRALLDATGFFTSVFVDLSGDAPADLRATAFGELVVPEHGRPFPANVDLRFALRSAGSLLVVSDAGPRLHDEGSDIDARSDLVTWVKQQIVRSALHDELFSQSAR